MVRGPNEFPIYVETSSFFFFFFFQSVLRERKFKAGRELWVPILTPHFAILSSLLSSLSLCLLSTEKKHNS